jgi:hypothetical protein
VVDWWRFLERFHQRASFSLFATLLLMLIKISNLSTFLYTLFIFKAGVGQFFGGVVHALGGGGCR